MYIPGQIAFSIELIQTVVNTTLTMIFFDLFEELLYAVLKPRIYALQIFFGSKDFLKYLLV